MKMFFSILALYFVFVTVVFAKEITEADKVYTEGNYAEAAELYEKELEKGVSARLYYNLGNAYFKTNQFPAAILNYERALLMAPGDSDIRFNLEMAKSRIPDRIVSIEKFFLVKWVDDLQNIQSSDGWAKLGIILFILLIICLFLFFFGRFTMLRKGSFYLGCLLILLVICCNIFSYKQKQKLTNKEYAILFEPSVTVKSSPQPDGQELFVIHEGVKVYIRTTLNGWCEIELEDGKVGWIPLSMVERI
ncbi:MAG: tetratricopeptide repeat protein [Candidatus Azobacteroides sp.]|nr:tetratricopeptide repeat protein [Candidatus Azobacteroides sp.]